MGCVIPLVATLAPILDLIFSWAWVSHVPLCPVGLVFRSAVGARLPVGRN